LRSYFSRHFARDEAKRYHGMDLSAWWLILNLIPGLARSGHVPLAVESRWRAPAEQRIGESGLEFTIVRKGFLVNHGAGRHGRRITQDALR
jgi:hypothetical protein